MADETAKFSSVSNGEVILVFAADALGYPEHDGREHESDVLGDVGVAVVGVLFFVRVQDVLEHEHRLLQSQAQECQLSVTLPNSRAERAYV